jgi:hypothetical protein
MILDQTKKTCKCQAGFYMSGAVCIGKTNHLLPQSAHKVALSVLPARNASSVRLDTI